MSRKRLVTYWACDFETTVWGEELERQRGKLQDITEVWSAAYVALYDKNEDVKIDNNIRDFLDYFLSRKSKDILYFHNLSFDGSFIVDFLLREGYTFSTDRDKDMPHKSFNSCISKMGSWYFIKIKYGRNVLEIRNSLKLLPASLDRIAKSFKTKHQKLEMVYEGDRKAYEPIPEKDKPYIKNDVLVLKEALEYMFDEGHDKLTIGSCCLEEFKNGFDKQDYEMYFPDISDMSLSKDFKYENAWKYVHKSYGGGWCFVNPKYQGDIVLNGVVYDVNSLYPSMMDSVSGNRFPVGRPMFFKGEIPTEVLENETLYYFIRFKCRFQLKENSLPWVHIRGNALYKGNENLYTTNVRYNGQESRFYLDEDGNVQDTNIELTMTCKDWKLFKETYDIYDLEMLDGCYFRTEIGLFDNYIKYYKEIKMNNKGFLREMAKLFLNNIYGKLAMSDDSSYKEPYLDTKTGTVKFILHEAHDKQVGYIACGSAITSYARNFTIRAALANIKRFCYADTDSIHLEGLEDAVGIVEDNAEFCCWKQECQFDMAYYTRQKVYAEHVVKVERESVTPYLDIKCAGMSKSAKRKFIEDGNELSALDVNLELENCNLKATRIKGGILLRNKTFKIRKSVDKKVNPVYT